MLSVFHHKTAARPRACTRLLQFCSAWTGSGSSMLSVSMTTWSGLWSRPSTSMAPVRAAGRSAAGSSSVRWCGSRTCRPAIAVWTCGGASVVWSARTRSEPFSSCVAAGLDGLEREDGLHDWGAALRAAAQLGQNAPGLEGGYGAFTDAADAGVAGVDLALTYRQRRAVAAAVGRGADAAGGALVGRVGRG